MALACDVRLAADDTVIGLGATRHGVIPDGAVLRLARVVGLGRAKELIMTARTIDAAEAEVLLAARGQGLAELMAAAARVRDAYLNLARTEIPAPVAGFVARRAVQVGQRIAPGNVLMTVAPLEDAWVDANFKENQLVHLRPGQPVTLIADAYGSSVEFHGKVMGFSAGTGAAFALLPAQNASGNWIKVVQRVPVRIALDAKELDSHPLQIGLSMKVDVDTHERNGVRLERVARETPAYETKAFDTAHHEADARIERIIAQNASASALAAGRSQAARGGSGRP
jgi:membrane fusion protein (multidrug efflux system)